MCKIGDGAPHVGLVEKLELSSALILTRASRLRHRNQHTLGLAARIIYIYIYISCFSRIVAEDPHTQYHYGFGSLIPCPCLLPQALQCLPGGPLDVVRLGLGA